MAPHTQVAIQLVAACPMTHKIACCRAINYEQASSLVPQATANRTCSSSSSSSPFKKLNATKCGCLLAQSLAGKTSPHTPQPNGVSFVVGISKRLSLAASVVTRHKKK